MNRKINISEVESEKVFKIIIVGDHNVGKSSILEMFVNEKKNPYSGITVGVEFMFKKLKQKNGKYITLHLWDTAGHFTYRSIVSIYLNSLSAAIVVYDITDRSTFESIDEWIKIIREENKCQHSHPTIIIGNKTDCESQRRVSIEDGQNLADKYGFPFYEVNMNDLESIKNIFSNLIENINETIVSDINPCKGVVVRKTSSDINTDIAIYSEKKSFFCPNKKCCIS